MKMKTFLASVCSSTPVTLVSTSFEPIVFERAIDMHFTRKVNNFSYGEMVIIASEFFKTVTCIEPDFKNKLLKVYVA